MRAANLEAEANATIAQANSELKDARGAATQSVQDAKAEKAQEAKQARDTAEERKRAARQAADQRAGAAKKQADETAAQRKGAADAAKRVESAVIRADQKLAEVDAQAKLDEAKDNRSSLHASAPTRIGWRVWPMKRKPSAVPRGRRCGRKPILASSSSQRDGNSISTAVGRVG
jgi:hypothetical protein